MECLLRVSVHRRQAKWGMSDMGNVGMLVSRSVIRAALNATVIAGLVVVAGCGGRRSADYYDAIQVALLAEGKLRTETAPKDAPYGAADLTRNFERIALYGEADLMQSGGEEPGRNAADQPGIRRRQSYLLSGCY